MLAMILQALAACFGTIAFSVFFRVPRKHFPTCGGIGAVAWIVYLLVLNNSDRNILAVLAASMTVVMLSRFWSVRNCCPLITYLIPGIFPLVPGIGVYNTVFAVINGEQALAMAGFITAFKSAFAIAISILTGIIIPTKYIVAFNNHLPKKKK